MAYLTHSRYGRNGTEITINNSSSYTGRAGSTPSDATKSTNGTYTYDQPQGQLASTTGNIYGIYDLSGGSWEYTAAFNKEYVDSGTGYFKGASYLSASGTNFASNGGISTKYATAYSNNTSTDSGDFTGKDVSHTGDGIREVWESSDVAWFSDASYFVTSAYPFWIRGGDWNNGTYAGVFYSCNYYRQCQQQQCLSRLPSHTVILRLEP